MEKNSWMLFKQDICKLLRISLYFLLFPYYVFFSWPWKYSKTKTIDDKNDPMDFNKIKWQIPYTIKQGINQIKRYFHW